MHFREIGQKSSEELAREGSGVKAFSSFLSELSTLVPETMIPNISVLLTHLEGEVQSHMFSTVFLPSDETKANMSPLNLSLSSPVFLLADNLGWAVKVCCLAVRVCLHSASLFL